MNFKRQKLASITSSAINDFWFSSDAFLTLSKRCCQSDAKDDFKKDAKEEAKEDTKEDFKKEAQDKAKEETKNDGVGH